jgi:hypothetical protein
VATIVTQPLKKWLNHPFMSWRHQCREAGVKISFDEFDALTCQPLATPEFEVLRAALDAAQAETPTAQLANSLTNALPGTRSSEPAVAVLRCEDGWQDARAVMLGSFHAEAAAHFADKLL